MAIVVILPPQIIKKLMDSKFELPFTKKDWLMVGIFTPIVFISVLQIELLISGASINVIDMIKNLFS